MPVTRRRVRDDDEEPEEEEEPRRRSRKARDEEPAEDEDRPRRSRRAAPRDDDDDEEDERPRRSSKRRARDDDDDDEEETPRRRRSAASKGKDGAKRRAPAGSVRSGWKGAKENKAKGGDFLEDLKVEKEPDLVKFLEDEPFASYRQHWVETPPAGIKKKSWICIEDGCPLCDLGDRPRMLTSFNVLHISTGAAPENKILTLGNKALGQLESFAQDPKTGPLTKLFWAISKSGKNQSTAYNFRPVKERDLEEDWDVEVEEVEEAIEDALEKVYEPADLNIPTKKQLREVSSGLMDEDDDDDYDEDDD